MSLFIIFVIIMLLLFFLKNYYCERVKKNKQKRVELLIMDIAVGFVLLGQMRSSFSHCRCYSRNRFVMAVICGELYWTPKPLKTI